MACVYLCREHLKAQPTVVLEKLGIKPVTPVIIVSLAKGDDLFVCLL